VVWRAGLDLEPIDVADPTQTSWLETLVWPEQAARLARLRAAIAVAAMDPPRVVKGDLRTDLGRLARKAPRHATLVIFHTAVLGYVAAPDEREAFARTASTLAQCWITGHRLLRRLVDFCSPSTVDHSPGAIRTAPPWNVSANHRASLGRRRRSRFGTSDFSGVLTQAGCQRAMNIKSNVCRGCLR
jgi:hypothetical protein